MKRTVTLLALVTAVMFFCGAALAAETKKPSTGKSKGKAKIVVEYVSFPDAYKQYEVYPWDTIKIDEFEKAYAAMIAQGKFEEWVKTLSGTAVTKNRMIRAFGQQFVLIVFCKPHLCDASQVIALYDPVRKHVYSILASDGKFSWFGQPPENIKDLLNVLLVEEFKAIYKGQS